MTLSFVHNYSARVAHRYMQMHSADATESLTKLSSGKRVFAARHDAASLAIGSRHAAEVGALKQASVNIGMAVSMMQIADGGMQSIQEVLIRMKALAVQAASGQLSTVERAYLDDEFSALHSEIDRIAEDTEFGSIALLYGVSVSQTAYAVTNIGNNIGQNDGIERITLANDANNVSDADVMRILYDKTTGLFTILNVTTAVSTDVAAPVAAPPPGDFIDVAVSTFDMTIRVNSSFKPSQNNKPPPGNPSLNEFTVAATPVTLPVGSRQYAFRVGTSVAASDEIIVTLESAVAQNLSSGLPDAALLSAAGANDATEQVQLAIDKVGQMRARLGADLNRMGFAAGALGTTKENIESARSAILDLDVASEIAHFSLVKLRSDVVVKMLSLANQTQRRLLALIERTGGGT